MFDFRLLYPFPIRFGNYSPSTTIYNSIGLPTLLTANGFAKTVLKVGNPCSL